MRYRPYVISHYVFFVQKLLDVLEGSDVYIAIDFVTGF